MNGDSIPDEHHVTRLCGGSHIKSDGSVSGTAFRLNQNDDSCLSTNWLEQLSLPNRTEEVKEIFRVLRAKLSRVGNTAKLAVINVGSLKSNVFQLSPDKRELDVIHDPEDLPVPDPSHSCIVRLQLEDDLIADLIAQTINELYPASSTN